MNARNTMEFSTYFYHSNRNPYCITFINNKKGLYKVIISPIESERYNLYDINEKNFIVTYDELQNSKNLYKIYILSLLMTFNKDELTYALDGKSEIMNCVWYIKTIKNWKNLYFTENYKASYGFNIYPTEISIDDIEYNNVLKKYYLECFEFNDYIFTTCNTSNVNKFIDNNINKYIEYYTYKITCNINAIENLIYSIKKYKMFIDKISKYNKLQDVDDIILAYIIKI